MKKYKVTEPKKPKNVHYGYVALEEADVYYTDLLLSYVPALAGCESYICVVNYVEYSIVRYELHIPLTANISDSTCQYIIDAIVSAGVSVGGWTPYSADFSILDFRGINIGGGDDAKP